MKRPLTCLFFFYTSPRSRCIFRYLTTCSTSSLIRDTLTVKDTGDGVMVDCAVTVRHGVALHPYNMGQALLVFLLLSQRDKCTAGIRTPTLSFPPCCTVDIVLFAPVEIGIVDPIDPFIPILSVLTPFLDRITFPPISLSMTVYLVVISLLLSFCFCYPFSIMLGLCSSLSNPVYLRSLPFLPRPPLRSRFLCPSPFLSSSFFCQLSLLSFYFFLTITFC
ncbi:hypothetical protein FRC15_011874 [Serendipita sp. 397]|nr:hypothetical protein FRC15_011874 [Serendipita sp. 397]KAG8792978.1 hypothetical protein FRC16_011185 [Serendipita sp. 398]